MLGQRLLSETQLDLSDELGRLDDAVLAYETLDRLIYRQSEVDLGHLKSEGLSALLESLNMRTAMHAKRLRELLKQERKEVQHG